MIPSRVRFFAIAGLSFSLVAGICAGQGIVGATHPFSATTPVNYPGVADSGTEVVAWSHTLQHEAARYIALHFESFDLAPGDVLEITDAGGGHLVRLTGRGKMQAGRFWARHIPGDTVKIRLLVRSPGGGAGFVIDEYAAGFRTDTQSVFPPDDRANAICYRDSHPMEYDRSRAVARLLINGVAFCTGSLVSEYNHLLTNQHCINTQDKALNTDFDFMAEAPTCEAQNCSECFPGFVFSGAILLESEPTLDYALLLLQDGDPASQFGHLEFDVRPPVLGEQIYFPQHSAGRAKQLGIFSSHPADTGGVSRVQSITRPNCRGGTHLETGYYSDSEGGSSGSPILATSSHKILVLNHCHGNGYNLGVPAYLFYETLEPHVLGLNLPGRIAPGAIMVSADSTAGAASPGLAIDREVDSLWQSSSAAGPHWLQIDLGYQAVAQGFRVWHSSAAGGPIAQNSRQLRIQSAPSAAGPWTTEFTGTNPQQEPRSTFYYPGTKPVRHLRVMIDDPGSDPAARVAEFEVFSEPPIIAGPPVGTNIATQSISAQASSEFSPAYGPDKAIDGVISAESKWTSADTDPPHTLTLDLGTYRSISGFILHQPSAAGEAAHLNASEFAFESGRSPAGPWYPEALILAAGQADQEMRAFLAPKDLRYVRLSMLNPSLAPFDDYARVPEFEVIEFAGISASFSATPTRGRLPLTVAFDHLYKDEAETWQWTFGDGQGSAEPSPMHTYPYPGTYTVTLAVSGPGGSHALTRPDLIEVLTVRADLDADGDVDLDDFGVFQRCLTGPGIPVTPVACGPADFDSDNDVDQSDLILLRECMGGSGMPPPTACEE